MTGQICGLIPVYNNCLTVESVATNLKQQLGALVVVNDGSDDGTETLVEGLATRDPANIHVLHLPNNQGKGAAVQAGLRHVKELGFTHALQVDADGQHNLADIPHFLNAINTNPRAMVLGAPVFDESIPAIRKYGRKLTQMMIALEAGSTALPDAMCGFRVYPVADICALGSLGKRMNFDPEVMIRAHWAGVPVLTVPTKVRYLTPDEGGISHFRMVHDNLLHVWTHTRLILQAPFRWLLRQPKE
ncbi:MAG: glycosyltransferase family 2 protein [Candidatus Thiodiazotropha sp. (ex Rostrolucina anterorostrata)]|nr:glycosyltransferase family 2 protein [Candidatus Thiodiazotropha sp. (ex Rostrolucina anterorostrata)]